MFDQASCRSTAAEVGRPGGRPMCTERAQQFWLEGRSTGRSTAMAPIDWLVDCQESYALWIWPWPTGRLTSRSKPRHGRPGGRPTGCNSQKYDRWPVDRPIDRQVILTCSWLPTAIFFRPINWGCFGLFSKKDFKWVFKLVFPTFLSVYLHLF